MSIMKDFDVLDAPLSDVHLVEANAGTGKTWNIEALVIRLLIEKKLEPGHVLVVTFTDAAAQELRERILERINQVYKALSESDYLGSDTFLIACRKKYGSQQLVLDHLENCKSRFDEASIYTIHSFCKQVLTDFRFEAGLETDMQILPDSRIIQQEVIKDEWRSLNHRFSKDTESQLADILTGKVSLAQLESSFNVYSAKTGVLLDSDRASLLVQATDSVKSRWHKLDPSKWVHDYVKVLEDAVQTWDNHKDEIRQQWLNTELSRFDYAKDGDKWESALTQFLDKPLSGTTDKHVEKFTSTFVQEKPLKKSSTAPRPDHSFFELIDILYHGKTVLENQILRESCERMKHSYLQKRQQQQVLIFDDLLAFTERALDPEKNGGNATLLTHALREKYPVALIDEFQDTDQIQYSIFRRIYVEVRRENHLLYMIGDPKQSIYLFRGADLKTYFKARNDAESTFTLSKNFRSTQPLIEGVNAVFSGKSSFLDDELTYKTSSADKITSDLIVTHESDAPLRFVDIKARNGNKSVSELAVMKWVISSISRLLSNRPAESTILDKTSGQIRQVHPGDIALLVGTHNQSRRLKNMLAEVGIPAVESGEISVFLSEEAGYLNLLLDVAQNPRRSRKVRALLTTPLFGLNSEQVKAAASDDIKWSQFIETFRVGEQIAQSKGILAGLRFLFDRFEIEKNLVCGGNGERSITNMRHLAELLHAEEASQRRSLSGLASWLLAQRSNANAVKSDDRNMRLESDDERVHIMTMHSSKGLQFPIVYAPFLWTKAWGKKSELFYKFDEKTGEFERRYDPDNLVHGDGIQLGRIENIQDKIRLLYVTLTRAEQRCYVPYSSWNDFKTSPLYASLITRLIKDGLSSESLGTAIVQSDSSVLDVPPDWDPNNLINHILSDLMHKSNKSIHFEQIEFVEKPVIFNQKSPQNVVKAREFDQNGLKRLFPSRIVSSYSSIQRKYGHESSIDAMQRDEHAGQDKDSSNFEVSTGSEVQLSRERKAILDFPKGATTGNYWHELLETVDFSDDSHWHEIVDQISTKYGFDDSLDKETVRNLIQYTVDCPIGRHPAFNELNPDMQGLKLSTLCWKQTLREMEFLYPYSGKELQTLVTDLREETQQNVNISALANIQFFDTTNLLTGLIDLVFESNGKFFILDYKSNYLGGTIADYSHAEIEKDIHVNGYNLQYHLYVAALTKYLSKQIHGFSYKKHFGGVFYLYWRGLTSADTTGVFYDKPNWELVEPLIEKVKTVSNISAYANIKNKSNSGSIGGES